MDINLNIKMGMEMDIKKNIVFTHSHSPLKLAKLSNVRKRAMRVKKTGRKWQVFAGAKEKTTSGN